MMAASLRKHIAVVLAAVLLPSGWTCFAQEPAGGVPPLQDETGMPDADVPALKQNVSEPFISPGDREILDDSQSGPEENTEIINGEELEPGQEPSFNLQLPGYESEAERILDDNTPPVPAADTTVQPQATGRDQTATENLSRRELRRLRKEAKNTPPYIPELSRETYKINSGRKSDVYPDMDIAISDDTLRTVLRRTTDSLPSPRTDTAEMHADSIKQHEADSIAMLTAKQRREMARMQRRADTTLYRHSPLFRDTLKIAPLTAISLAVPGFGQLYNGDYWKIPVLYATAGTSLAFGIMQNKQYVRARNEYDYLTGRSDFSSNRDLIDPVQTRMIQHNTWRQMLFGVAAASYIYFLCDAVLNYPAADINPVKTATTLSMLCPGAGQIYNGSFWKTPLVLGGFATFIYVIDWNNRGYQRYTTAIRLQTDNDPDTNPDRSFGTMSLDQMRSYQRSYRRNRDLAIILTAAFYLLNVMDAHVDAHMRDFDVGDDLAWQLRPTIEPLYAMQGYNQYSFGLGLSLTF